MLERLYPLKLLVSRYVSAGASVGDDLSYIYLGAAVNLEGRVKRWAKLEVEYSRRGFRTITLDDFIDHGGYGKNINHLLYVKREQNEDPCLHSVLFVKCYGTVFQMDPALAATLDPESPNYGKPSVGSYDLPTTKDKA